MKKIIDLLRKPKQISPFHICGAKSTKYINTTCMRLLQDDEECIVDHIGVCKGRNADGSYHYYPVSWMKVMGGE